MKRKVIFATILVLFCLYCYGCKPAQPQGEVLAKINDYVLTVEDFKSELKHSPYTVSNMDTREDLIDLIIRRELLVQEAQRQGLDRNDDFMRTIERYWKQTLVKEILKAENKRLKESIGAKEAMDSLDQWIEALRSKADIVVDEELLNKIDN